MEAAGSQERGKSSDLEEMSVHKHVYAGENREIPSPFTSWLASIHLLVTYQK